MNSRRELRNIGASVRDRLLRRSRETGENFQFLIQRYASERFLYRLGESHHRERYVLKGATLFALWGGSMYRGTRDLDFTGYGSDQVEDVLAAMRDICAVPVTDDGLTFDAATLAAEPIRDSSEYRGLRIRFRAVLAGAHISMQIDIGFGNAIEPPATDAEYPTLLDAPCPRIRAYPVEAVVAEKMHAMAVLGERNTRLKDFYDIYVLARQFSFDGERLTRAIAATFERRLTVIAVARPAMLTARFYDDEVRAEQWRGYLARNQIPGAPADWVAVGELLQAFLIPPWEALARREAFSDAWSPGGSWNSVVSLAEAITADAPIRRFKPYPAYRDSKVEWLGQIPAQWKAVPLKHVFNVLNGSTPQSGVLEYWDGEIPWVTPEDLGDLAGWQVDATRRRITEVGYRSCGTSLAPAGSLILSTRAPIGHLAIAGMELCTNQGCRSLVFLHPRIRKFFYYQMFAARAELESLGQGSTFRELGKNKLEALRIVVPEESEQRAIAAFLDRETARIDALVAKKEKLIDLLQEQRTALITRAVTKGLDPNAPMKDSSIEWLGEIPAYWEIKPLKFVFVNLDKRRVPLSGEERAMMAKEYPYYGASGVIDHVESYLFDEPLILVAEDGANLYSRSTPLAFVAEGKYWVNNHAHILRPLDGLVTYWAHVLGCVIFDPWISGSAQPKLTGENLGSIPLPLPPVREREELLAFCNGQARPIDNVIAKAREAIGRLNEFRTALISDAVTGKIDVRGEVA